MSRRRTPSQTGPKHRTRRVPDAAQMIADALGRASWSAWAKSSGQPELEPTALRVEHVGQAFEVLRLFGPLPIDAKDALNAFVASSGRYWLPQATTTT